VRQISVVNDNNGIILAINVGVTETNIERSTGLLGTYYLPYSCGLLIQPCHVIHTFGMRYDIDVLFLDDNFGVLEIIPNLPPMQTAYCIAGKMALELPAGTADATRTKVGHRLREYAV